MHFIMIISGSGRSFRQIRARKFYFQFRVGLGQIRVRQNKRGQKHAIQKPNMPISGSPEAVVLENLMKLVSIQSKECADLLRNVPESRTSKHMMIFTKMLSLTSMLTYYVMHQSDAMSVDDNEKPPHECEHSLDQCSVLCDDIASTINSRPMDVISVNQILTHMTSMLSSVRHFLPLRILHVQPSADKPLIPDNVPFLSNMSGMVEAVERERVMHSLVCTESMSVDYLGRHEILSQYFPGCGALGKPDTPDSPYTPTSPVASRTLKWCGSPERDGPTAPVTPELRAMRAETLTGVEQALRTKRAGTPRLTVRTKRARK